MRRLAHKKKGSCTGSVVGRSPKVPLLFQLKKTICKSEPKTGLSALLFKGILIPVFLTKKKGLEKALAYIQLFMAFHVKVLKTLESTSIKKIDGNALMRLSSCCILIYLILEESPR